LIALAVRSRFFDGMAHKFTGANLLGGKWSITTP
jgi:hypothetical protein